MADGCAGAHTFFECLISHAAPACDEARSLREMRHAEAELKEEGPSVFAFGDYELDERVLELRRAGKTIELQPKPLLVLRHLIRNADRVVGHQELQDVIWPGVSVTEASLKTALYTVRRALGDRGDDPQWIATVPRFGYRFRGKVERLRDDTPRALPSPARGLDAALAFVDRETELRTLRAALASARQGQRRIVLLHGAPGIGKTRTALEVAREGETQGFEVHIGRVEEGGGAPAYWPWTQILRSLARARSGERMRAGGALAAPDWVRLVPELSSSLAPTDEPDRVAAGQARFRLLDGVTQLLHDAAQEKPLLLVLDDLHWADEASLALLAFVARNLPRAPLLAIGTHRELDGSLDPGRAQALARIGRDLNVESLALRGLERASVVRILEETLGSVREELVDRVERATGGNPFFVSEVARWLAEQGRNAARRARLPVPERLREAVLLRVAERSSVCQQLLRSASVIGTHFTLPLLRRSLDLSVDALLAALGEAEHADLLRQEGASGHYRFAHGVVREALYEQLADAERMRLHAAIGEALEKLHAPDTDLVSSELAHHFCESAALANPLRAIEYACAAAEKASASFAYAESGALYRRALQLFELLESPAVELRCELLIRRAQAQRMIGAALEPAHELCAEAMRLARQVGRPDLLARAAEVAASDARDRGVTLAILETPSDPIRQRHIDALEEALPQLGPEHADIRGQALLALGELLIDGGERMHAAEIASEVLRVGEERDDPVLIARALTLQLGLRPALDGVEAERLAWTDRIVELSRVARRPDLELTAYSNRAFIALMRGERALLDATSANIQRLAKEVRLPSARANLHAILGLRAQLDGRLEEAEREALETARVQARFQASPRWIMSILSMPYWWLALLRGQAAQVLQLMQQESRRFGPVHIGHLFIGRLQCELGAREEAQQILDRHVSWLGPASRDDGWPFISGLAAEICNALGDRAHAAELYALLRPYQVATLIGSVICTGSLARPLGGLAALLGELDECDALFAQALAHADGLRSPVLRAWTELDYARALRGRSQSGVRARRRQLLESVLGCARELGMPGVEAAARREADASR